MMQEIKEKKIILVLTIENMEAIVPTFEKLRANNIRCAEITFRTQCAPKAIAEAVRRYSDMEIGAGTVLTAEQCREAIEAGAKFIVSPGISEDVYRVCEKQVPYYPGCVTPTEIMHALSLNLRILKFFPASIFGGLHALKTLSAPFPQVMWIPTGGIRQEDIEDYFSFDRVYAVGGSFFADIQKEG